MSESENDQEVTVQISAPLMWGFRVAFGKRAFDVLTDERIVEVVKEKLVAYFERKNMVELVALAKKLELHLDRCCGTGESLTGPRRSCCGGPAIVYACDHRHERF